MSRLGLANNHFRGPIPSEIGQMENVEYLALSMNGFNSTLPTTFLQLKSLTQLYLQNTLLTGDVAFLCEAVDRGLLNVMSPMRIDMLEVSGCSCCTCCQY